MDESQINTHNNRNMEVDVDVDTSSVPKRKRRTFVIVVSILVVAALCIGVCVVVGGYGMVSGMVTVIQERDDVTAIIDQFMQEMERKNVEVAFEMLSPRAQGEMNLSELEELVDDNNYVIFDGYQSVEVMELNIKVGVNTNPNALQGTLAEVTAIVTYDEGFKGNVRAVLEEVNDNWMIYHINITIPPSKMVPKK